MVQHASKPFDIQSPQKIAMEYGGNKQKIAQAMQLGIVDSTAGVLAGMFIDKMRSAQMQEQAQQPTIAQQVMGGAQPSPAAGAPPAGGLGAASQGAPPMAPSAPPQGGMPPAPPMGAPPQGAPPMGMAEGGMVPPYAAGGGLSDLPVPDTMFDESDNGGYGDGYSGGGLVAFADGGDTLGWMDTGISSEYGVSRSTGRHQGRDYRTPGGTPIGAVAPGVVKKAGYDDINGNYVVVQHPDGSSTSYAHLAKLSVAEGQPVSTGGLLGLSGNTGRVRGAGGGYHLHLGARDAQGNRVDPRSMLGRLGDLRGMPVPKGWERLPAESSGAPSAQGAQASWSGGESLEKSFPGLVEKGLDFFDKYMPAPKREAREMLLEEARAELSPERQKKMRDEDKWSTLAEIGFNMAASNSPYFLQAVGAAAAAALPGARAAKKARDAARREALRNYAELEGLDNKEARERVSFGLDYAKSLTGLKDKDIGRFFEQQKTQYQEAAQTKRTGMQVAGGISQANITAGSYANTADKQIRAAQIAANAQARKEAVDLAQKDPRWMVATQKGDTATAAAIVEEYYNRSRASLGGGLSDLGGGADAGQGRTVSQGKIINAVPIPQ